MGAIRNAITCSLLLVAPALSGCSYGGSSSPSAAATASSSNSPRRIALESPAMGGTSAIPPRYTCDGKNVSLPLRWGALPPGTRELVLMVLALTPVSTGGPAPQGAVREKVSVQWAVAGLRPTLHSLGSGTLPPGAVLGHNSEGHTSYSICPPEGTSKSYLVTIFAANRTMSLRRGFNGRALLGKLTQVEAPFGQIFANYSRA